LIPEGTIDLNVRAYHFAVSIHSGRRDLSMKAKGARWPEAQFDSAAKGRKVMMRVADGSRCKSGTVAPL
jgi:hypothetical protein